MRYLVLIALNIPIIFLALTNIITEYKLGRVRQPRFVKQLALWLVILIVLVGSFPIYNIIMSRPILDSIDLSAFDIVQTTAIVFLFYFINNMRQQLDRTERRLRDLHQELSIKLSANGKD